MKILHHFRKFIDKVRVWNIIPRNFPFFDVHISNIELFNFLSGDVLEDADFEQEIELPHDNYTGISNQNSIEDNRWPFPNPNKGLDKYLAPNETSYMDEFEKWWDVIQQNKSRIAESEFNNLVKSTGITKIKR